MKKNSSDQTEPEGEIPISKRIMSLTESVMHWFGIPKKKPQVDRLLLRRMSELKRIAQDVLFQLKEAEEDVKKAGDSELSNYVGQVVDPMIRDVNRIERIAEKGSTESEQLELVDKYSQWISKAKPWVHFFTTQGHDKQAMIKAVIRQTVHLSDELITKDLQIIQDYQNHKFSEINIDEDEKTKLKKRVDSALHISLEKLNGLRNVPTNLDLEQLEEWKSETNALREELYNEALHTVDGIIQEANIQAPEEQEELKELQILNFAELADLEESVPKLLEDIEKNTMTKELRQKFRQELTTLEREAQELEQELLLTPELYQRLQKVKQSLLRAHSKLWPHRIKRL